MQKKTFYQALCGDMQATGASPGAALDAIDNLVAAKGEDGNGTLVILQRFRPDTFFTKKQKERLEYLMERFHAAKAEGKDSPLEEQKELEKLVEAEWQRAIDRADEILRTNYYG